MKPWDQVRLRCGGRQRNAEGDPCVMEAVGDFTGTRTVWGVFQDWAPTCTPFHVCHAMAWLNDCAPNDMLLQSFKSWIPFLVNADPLPQEVERGLPFKDLSLKAWWRIYRAMADHLKIPAALRHNEDSQKVEEPVAAGH